MHSLGLTKDSGGYVCGHRAFPLCFSLTSALPLHPATLAALTRIFLYPVALQFPSQASSSDQEAGVHVGLPSCASFLTRIGARTGGAHLLKELSDLLCPVRRWLAHRGQNGFSLLPPPASETQIQCISLVFFLILETE